MSEQIRFHSRLFLHELTRQYREKFPVSEHGHDIRYQPEQVINVDVRIDLPMMLDRTKCEKELEPALTHCVRRMLSEIEFITSSLADEAERAK